MKRQAFVVNDHVTVADEVILALVFQCLLEFSPTIKPYNPVKNELLDFVSKNGKKGITIKKEDVGIIVDIKVSLLYDEAFLPMCINLQHRIKNDLENMLGLMIQSVNLQVESVHFVE